MKASHHKPKGTAQRIFPGRGALNDLVKKRPSINNYAKAAPNVVRSARRIGGKKP